MKVNSKKRTNKIFFTGGIIGVLVLILLAAWKLPVYMDKSYFADMKKKQIVLVNDLSKSLGDNVLSKRGKDECFDTGQGPYDNGYLWCQTSTVFVLANDMNPQELGTEFLKAAETLGSGREAQGYELPLYLVELSGGSKCHLGIKTASGQEVNGARRNPFDLVADKSMVAVTCGDRAKARHYQ